MIGGANKLIDSVRNYRNAIFGSDVNFIGCHAQRFDIDRPDSALKKHGLVEKAHLNPMMCVSTAHVAALSLSSTLGNDKLIGRRAPPGRNR